MYFDPRLWRFTAGLRGRITGSVIIGLVAAAAGVARLALLGWLMALLFAGAGLGDLMGPVVLVSAVMVARGVLEYWRDVQAHTTSAAVQRNLRLLLYDKIVDLGPAHFGLNRTGDTILTLVDGVEQLETYFGRYLPQLFVALITPLAIFAFIAFIDLPVATVMVACALVTLIAPGAFHRWDSHNAMARQRDYGAFASEFLDSLQGLATLQAFGQSEARGRLLADKAHKLFQSTMWVLATNALSRGITDTGIALGAAGALGLGAWRVAQGDMSLAALLVILMVSIEVYRPLRDLRSMLHEGMVGRAAAAGVFALMDAQPRVTAAKPSRTEDDLPPTISFEDVAFSYPGSDRPVHRRLDFQIASGERVGIVGASGAGKSTILQLLLRHYDPSAGTVRVGGRDLKELGLDQVRAQFSVVGQDTYLFHGTVAENLWFGKPGAGRDELETAARAANAHEFIQALPNGYDTVIGERGIRLSGGQRQRIAIARALLRDAPILLLDEALSAVDAENEAVIGEALRRLMQGRTTLVIAHRLSSVIDADRILVVEDGRIVESGDHVGLAAAGGAYWRLIADQAAELGAGPETWEDRILLPDTPDAAEIEPAPASDDDPNEILRADGLGWLGAWRVLGAWIAPWRGKLVATFLFGVTRVLALIGVSALGALLLASVKRGEPFAGLLIMLAIAAPAAGILHWLESWLAHDMAFRLLAEMRIALFTKLNKLAPAYLLRRRSGDLVAMATHDVELVEFFFAHTIAPAFVAVLVPATVLAILSLHGSAMALALLPFLAVVALSPFLMRGRVDRLGSRARESLGELNAFAVDTVQGLKEIAAFGHEAARRQGLADRIDRHHSHRLPYFRDLSLQTVILELATGFGGLAVVIAGAVLVTGQKLDSGLMPLMVLLAMAAFLPIAEIANVGRQLADTLGATRRLHAVHQEVPAVADHGTRTTSDQRPSIEFADVTFAYPARQRLAVDGISFTATAGSTIALVGASGAGKTTIAHLIMRFFDPERGTIRLAGTALQDYSLDALRNQIALVAQDTYLFHASLRDNILIAKPDASDDDVAAAIGRADLGEFIASLPDGLETQVGERGLRLSGGQRQRVAIARAFLKDAPVLVLDEATSHLDSISEKAIRRALAELMQERTTVVIAHRLSTVSNADHIVVMDHGRIVEAGSHAALLARAGIYARLVARQIAGSSIDAAQ